MPDFYHTITMPSTAEFRDRGSRFLAYAFPISTVEEFKQRRNELKKEHPKAVHHCFAYRLGPGGSQFRVSDDGEPSGSAGRPILGALDSKQLTDVLVVVVRYFGGTLLGVPGLINAYRAATALAIEATSIIQKPVLIPYRLQFDYTKMNDVMRIVKQADCVVSSQVMQLFCILDIGIPKQIASDTLKKFRDIHGVNVDLPDNPDPELKEEG